MVIGAEEDGEELGELAGLLVVPAELLLLLLPPLLHAARTPTQSATAPSAAPFLENQGRCALTPGSSFLIGHESSVRIPGPPGTRPRWLCRQVRVPRRKRGETDAAGNPHSAVRWTSNNRLQERLDRSGILCQSSISNLWFRRLWCFWRACGDSKARRVPRHRVPGDG